MITALFLLILNKHVIFMDEEQNIIENFITELKRKREEKIKPSQPAEVHSPVINYESDNTSVHQVFPEWKIDENSFPSYKDFKPTDDDDSYTKEEREEMIHMGTPAPLETLPFKTYGNLDLISKLNQIHPNRFSPENVGIYDYYDSEITKAMRKLRLHGEKVNPKLVKAIMLVETGMKPRINRKGYFGFPQTRKSIISYINNKYNKHFTTSDMYDAEKASEFIHYYLKDVANSSLVNNYKDAIIAYNWGLGNLRKYKKGEASLPEETQEYVKLVDTIMNYDFTIKILK